MAATALIKFTQNAVAGTAGRAYFGATGLAVTVDNDVNTGVASWQIELVAVPSGSAVSTGVLAFNNNSATPTVNFTPDVVGGYRIVLSVWGAINRVGTPTDVDIRNFGIKDTNGFYRPAPQLWPRPLPPTQSGETGNKPDENNFGGQANGWVGDGTDGLMDQRLAYPSRADALRELGGPTVLVVGTIADGKVFQRSGTQITGVNVPGGLAAGTQTGVSGTIAFVNSNNITFGMSGSTQITGSIPAGATATGNLGALGAGTQTATSGTVVFVNSNGLTFGMSGSTQITGSYTVPSTAGLLSAVNLSAGTTSSNASAFVFSNSNNVSFGLNGATLTATISVPAQTNQTVGLFGLGNTTQNSSTTLDARSLSFNGLGIVTVGYSNGSIQVSATTAAQSNQTEGRYAIGNTTGQSSSSTFDARTMSLSGAGLVSVGYSGNAVVISVTAAQTVQTQNVVVPSAGTQTATSGTVVFSNSNGISFGMSNSSVITASYTVPTQTNQTVGLFGLGNTTQNSSTTLDARSLSFNGLGIVTVGYSNGSIQVSATTAAQTVQTQSNVQGISAGTQVGRTGDIVFSNSNNVTFGMSGSNTVTASIPAGATATGNFGALAAGTQTATSGTVAFVNSNGLTFGMSGSTQITGSYTVPSVAGLISAVNISAGTTSNNLTALTFNDGNGVSFGLNGSVVTASVAGAAAGIAAVIAGTQTKTSGTLSFSNVNGVSFGLAGSNTITASVAAQTNQTIGLYAVGNTTQNSSTTLDARTLSFNALGGMTMGYSNGSIQASAPGTSSLSATGALSISVNGVTVSIGVPVRNVSYLNLPEIPWNTNFTISNASLSLQHFNPRADIVASQANFLMALSGNTNSTGALTISMGVYTMSGSTMSLASSDSRQISWTSGSQTTNSTVYGGISGTRYRTVALANWSLTAGDYMLGLWYRTTNDGVWRIFGQQGPTIVGAVDANETNQYFPGFSTSSFTTAMIASVNVTNTNFVRTGADALQQPGVIFLGSF